MLIRFFIYYCRCNYAKTAIFIAVYCTVQVPLPFLVEQERTLEVKGTKEIWIAQQGSGALAKRQATIQLAFSPVPEIQPEVSIIFPLQGSRITKLEKASYDRRGSYSLYFVCTLFVHLIV